MNITKMVPMLNVQTVCNGDIGTQQVGKNMRQLYTMQDMINFHHHAMVKGDE